MATPKKKIDGLLYKGHPLRRKDTLVYYGSMAERYIVMMQILDKAEKNGVSVPTRVSLELQLTDPDLKSRDRVVKKSEKNGLYSAIDVGSVWLDRALERKA